MEEKANQSVLTGGCHCGNIRYRLTTDSTLQELPQRQCHCSFCSKHGAVYTADPAGKLIIEIHKPESVTHYQFASREVSFLHCSHCGVLTAALTEIEGNTYGVINANALDDRPDLSPVSVSFATETPEQARQRRQRNWTGSVTTVNAIPARHG